MTHKSTWKKREGAFAKLFGAKRTALSGGNSGGSRSDSNHPRLFIECKLRERHACISLWDKTHALARLEKKKAVVILAEKNRPSGWVVCKIEDLPAIAEEYLGRPPGDDSSESASVVLKPSEAPLEVDRGE